MIRFFGDSFSLQQVNYDLLGESKELHWTHLLASKMNLDYKVQAYGGFSNEDILARIINDIQNWKEEDIVIVGTTVPTRVLTAFVQHPNKPYALQGCNVSILENSDNWKLPQERRYAYIDFVADVLDHERDERHKFWIEQMILPLLESNKDRVDKVVLWGVEQWKRFRTNRDMGRTTDRHWSREGHDDFSKYILESIQTHTDWNKILRLS